MKILLAGILGGIAMFIWSFIGHDLLPLGEVGIRNLPKEDALRDTLKTDLGDANGLYMFPWPHAGPNATKQEKSDAMKAAMDKATTGPSGILLYHPARQFSFGKLLGVEFVTEVVEAILIAFLLAQTAIGSFIGRVGFFLIAGIVAAMATNVPYWNWYGFPKRYTAAYMFIQVIGFLCAGIIAALVLGKRAAQSAA